MMIRIYQNNLLAIGNCSQGMLWFLSFCCCSDGGSGEGIVTAADAVNDTPVVGAIAIPMISAATKTGITIVEFTSLVLFWFTFEVS